MTSNEQKSELAAYWRTNLLYLVLLLGTWFIVSFGFGIILAKPLNGIIFLGSPLGFWFAQQGSVYTFVIIIFVYVWLMNRLDRKYNVRED